MNANYNGLFFVDKTMFKSTFFQCQIGLNGHYEIIIELIEYIWTKFGHFFDI